ncbi:MAG: HNH endonuclease [Verrucomicrobiales bacterium]
MANDLPDDVSRNNLIEAIERIEGGMDHAFADSTKYDVLFGGKRFPPKAVVGVAAEIATGKMFSPEDFSGGVDSKCFRILKQNGFTIVAKSGAGDTSEDIKRPTALFINGIYDEVLTEIIEAQNSRGGGESYIQPYKGQVIGMLRKNLPNADRPTRLYVSTTENLSKVCYTALIVDWDDKRELPEEKRDAVRQHLKAYQPGEVNLFLGAEGVGEKAVNLITIKDLKELDTLHSTALLRKVSDDLPLQKRTRSGGWSEVYDLGNLLDLSSGTRDQYDAELAEEIDQALKLSDSALQERLSSAPRIPEKIQIISTGFRRNSSVIVSVLRRSNGICERCGVIAPFLRRSDNSPYLEVHHWIPLSQGGEDTVENAAALCPNCHREVHHGQVSS